MSYENCSIYLIASGVSENTQEVNINCTCNQKIKDLQKETSVAMQLLQENRRLMLKLMSLIQAPEAPASKIASVNSASESASVEGKIAPKSI